MLNYATSIITVLFVGKLLWSIVRTEWSLRYLAAGTTSATLPSAPPRVFVVIPLLREAHRIPALLTQFGGLMQRFAFLHLVLVTTEREHEEHVQSATGAGTVRAIAESNVFGPLPTDRRRHIHFPSVNRTLAEQLNYALEQLWLQGDVSAKDYLLLYNADSEIDDATIRALVDRVARGALVVQQSSLCIKNIAHLMERNAFLAVAGALYQSRWTLDHEIPRYLIGAGVVRRVPGPLAKWCYAHCVGHGLLIQVGLLRNVGWLPETEFGLEDSALGFALRARGHTVCPLPVLEVNDAPTTFKSSVRQKATWVRGPLGAPEYCIAAWRTIGTRPGILWLGAQGLWSGIQWAFGIPLFIAYVVASSFSQQWIAAAVGYGVYSLLPVVAVARACRHTPSVRLSLRGSGCIKWLAVLGACPLAPIVHGLSGLCGTMMMIKQCVWHEKFMQMKTDG